MPLFSIKKSVHRAQQHADAGNMTKQMLRSYLWSLSSGAILVTAIFAILGVTPWVGGPYAFFTVLFFFSLLATIFWVSFLVMLYRKLIRLTQPKKSSGRIHVQATVISEDESSNERDEKNVS